MLREIADALYRIALRLAEMVGLLALLGVKIDQTVVEDSPYLLQRRISDIRDATVLNAASNANLLTHLHSIIALLGDGVPGVLTAIQELPAGSDLVIPPSTETAEAVWRYLISQQQADGIAYEAMAEEWLYNISHTLALMSATDGFGDNRQPWYRLVFGGLTTGYSYGYNWNIYSHTRPVSPDFTAVLAADTVLSFLQRTQPSGGWTGQGPSGAAQTDIAWKRAVTAQVDIWWRTAFQLPALALAAGAPIWPGIGGVTPGAPVALADDLVITGPLHGILLDLTVLPSGGTAWQVGATKVPYNWGQVGFMSDNGEMEQFQWLSAEHSVYLPKQMAVAASASFRVTRPCTATVTPFTIP